MSVNGQVPTQPTPSEPDFEAMWSGYEQHIQQLKTADEQSMEIFPEPGLVVKTRLWFRVDPQYGSQSESEQDTERKRGPIRSALALAQAGAEAAAEQKDSVVTGQSKGEKSEKVSAVSDVAAPVKAFLNLCQSKHIAPPAECLDPNDGQTKLRVPLSCGQPMPDTDKEGGPCVVFDVVFNPQAIQQCIGDTDSELKQTIIAFTIDNIQRKHAVTLDHDIKFPKLRYKGSGAPPSQRIRKTNVHISAPAIQEVAASAPKASAAADPSSGPAEAPLPTVPPVVTPNHQLYCLLSGSNKVTLQDYEKQFLAKAKKASSDKEGPASAEIPLPKTLLLEIDLPLAKSTAELDVTVSPTDLLLRGAPSSSGAPSLPYALHLLFPFKVDDAAVVSKFSKAHQKLLLQLPVVGVFSDETEQDIDAENVTDFRAALGFRNKLMYQLAT